jgi:D-alanyl-D-alanine carboxypeptidase
VRAISVLALSVACWLVAAPAPAQTNSSNSRPLALSAESVLLLDTQGRVLYAKNPRTTPREPRKLMTSTCLEALDAGRAQWRSRW